MPFSRDNFVAARKAARLTQQQLHELSGVSRSTIGCIEAGHSKKPSGDVLSACARAMGVSTDLFFADDCLSKNENVAHA